MDIPILFHAFKHHLGFGYNWIIDNQGNWNDSVALMLKSIGASQLDYYTGQYSSDEIKQQVFELLSMQQLTEKRCYRQWLAANNGFREVVLPDTSRWILRYTDKPEYIHLHPGRCSPHTVRIKAGALKTVICALLSVGHWDCIDYEATNRFRINRLGLSPVDISKEHWETEKVFALFQEWYYHRK